MPKLPLGIAATAFSLLLLVVFLVNLESVHTFGIFEEIYTDKMDDRRPAAPRVKAGMDKLDLRFAPGGTLVLALNADKIELRKKRVGFLSLGGHEEAHLEKVAIEYYEPEPARLAEHSAVNNNELSETLGSLGSCLPVGGSVTDVSMHEVSLRIFLRDGEGAFITSNAASIDHDTHTLRLSGDVEAVSPHFTLAEEELRLDTRNMSLILSSGAVLSLRGGFEPAEGDSLASAAAFPFHSL